MHFATGMTATHFPLGMFADNAWILVSEVGGTWAPGACGLSSSPMWSPVQISGGDERSVLQASYQTNVLSGWKNEPTLKYSEWARQPLLRVATTAAGASPSQMPSPSPSPSPCQSGEMQLQV